MNVENKGKSLYELFFKEEDMNKIYNSGKEHFKELICMLDAYLNLAFIMKGEEGLNNLTMRGLVISEKEVHKALKANTVTIKDFKISDVIIRDFQRMNHHIETRCKNTIEQGLPLPMIIIGDKFGLTNFEKFAFIVTLASHISRNYETLYSYLQNDIQERAATKGLIISLYEMIHEIDDFELGNFLYNTGNLAKYVLIKSDQYHTNQKLSEAVYIEKSIISYLMGDHAIYFHEIQNKNLFLWNEMLEPLLIHHDIVKIINNVMKNYYNHTIELYNKKESLQEIKENQRKKFYTNNCLICILGETGIGKKFLIKHAAKNLKCNVLFYDLTIILNGNLENWKEKLSKAFIKSILWEAILCLSIKEVPEDVEKREIVLQILEYMKKESILFVIIGEKDIEEILQNYDNMIKIEVPILSTKEKLVLWEEYGKTFTLDHSVNMQLNTNKYIFNPKVIKEVLSTAKLHADARNSKSISQNDIILAAKSHQKKQLGNYAVFIHTVFTWEDLIVEETQEKLMKLVCSHIQYRHIVGEDWGFHEKMPYGKGVTAMFYGVAGTGKTMAAQVIANELGLDLYKIDLSQMMSKYIGETEKNISELFDKAKNIHAILFFDEADTMFAKRSEVKDSHDKNANATTGHLLQKLEEYEGIIILATNFIHNIDDAFKRRIKFMIPFAFPAEKVRLELFKSIFPTKAKKCEELDFEYFAKNFQLSGSSIKEILLNAAYMAAVEERGIGNRDIAEAVKINLAKYGKILREEEIGYWN